MAVRLRDANSCLRALALLLPLALAPVVAQVAEGAEASTTAGVTVQMMPEPRAIIRHVLIRAYPEATVVLGQVSRRGVYDNAFAGAKVTGRAVLPDGSVREQVDTLLTPEPRFRNYRTIYPNAAFRLVFPERLPSGTTLYLKFVAGSAAPMSSLGWMGDSVG